MSDARKPRVMVPADVDILLGRGKPFQNHPGNQRMLSLVDEKRERYHQAERREKHEIVEEVMGIIRESGGRFLRKVDYESHWVEVQHAISYRKVGHAFRSKARKSESSNKPLPPMKKQRVEAPPLDKQTPTMEEILLEDLRIRRAALRQADMLTMNAAMGATTSPLESLILPSLYNKIAATGFLQSNRLMNPSLLAAMGSGAFSSLKEPSVTGALSAEETAAAESAAPAAPSQPILPTAVVP